MTALAEALTAAQRQAIAVLEKAYVAGAFEDDGLLASLDRIGCTDAVDQNYLRECLDTIRTYGGQAPKNGEQGYAEKRESAPPTDAQKAFIDKLVREKQVEPPDLAGVTRAQASELIEQLKAGTYDPDKWSIPF